MRRNTAAACAGAALIALASVAAGITFAQERPDDARAIRKEIESIFQAFIDKDRDKDRGHARPQLARLPDRLA